MRKIIEYTLISVDGVFGDPAGHGFMAFRDDAYLRDGLELLANCDAMLMGRNFYETSAAMWPHRGDHPWAARLNAMKKHVFSSTAEDPQWNNTEVVRGDVVEQAAKLKEQEGGHMVIWGHTQLAETLMRHGLIDLLDVSVHPLLAGAGCLLLREGLHVDLRLVATKTFSKIVKLSYEPQYR